VQPLTVKDPEGLATEAQRMSFALDARCLERYPPEAAASPTAHSPAQFVALGRHSLLRVLGAHALNRVCPDTLEVLCSARRQVAEIKARKPLTLTVGSGGCRKRALVTEVVNLVDLNRSRVEPSE